MPLHIHSYCRCIPSCSEYTKEAIEYYGVKKGIKLHLIKTELFKTNLACVLITVPLKKEEVTLNTLIPFLLKRGTANLKTQYEINETLESLYGSVFDCGIDKSGDNQIIKFYYKQVMLLRNT